MFGFTCGMSDVLLVESANRKRAELLQGADVRALDAAAQLVGLPSPLELLKQGFSPVSTLFPSLSPPLSLCLSLLGAWVGGITGALRRWGAAVPGLPSPLELTKQGLLPLR
jgi:hypothetical protein